MSWDYGAGTKKAAITAFLWGLLASCLALVNISVMASAHANDQRAKVSSGETQVLAKIGKREITVSELRVEFSRLGLTEATPETERLALQSIINRHLLVTAAREAGMHRKPEAALRIKAAQEQTLADFYIRTASQPPEPTLVEVEDYIAQNPSLFGKRTEYTFLVLSLATNDFDAETLTPLFSETKDFSDLEATLKANKVTYAKKPLVQASSGFPKEIRQQLARYDLSDNIVIQSDRETQIMKIRATKPAPLPAAEWQSIARRIVMEESAVRRARSLLDSLKLGNSVTYFRKDLAPQEAVKKLEAKPVSAGKATGK